MPGTFKDLVLEPLDVDLQKGSARCFLDNVVKPMNGDESRRNPGRGMGDKRSLSGLMRRGVKQLKFAALFADRVPGRGVAG